MITVAGDTCAEDVVSSLITVMNDVLLVIKAGVPPIVCNAVVFASSRVPMLGMGSESKKCNGTSAPSYNSAKIKLQTQQQNVRDALRLQMPLLRKTIAGMAATAASKAKRV